MKSLKSLGEFGFLKRLLPKLYWPKSLYPQLVLGAGDDAGVLRISRGKVLVATTDALVENRHFRRAWFPWEDLGYKALAVNLSDLAAMGDVKPLAALVTAAFPGDTSVESVDKLHAGLNRCAQRWKTGFLGGDTVGSDAHWMISVTVLGEADPAHLVRRSGARPGDLLIASGPLGLAGAGLQVLEKGERRRRWTAPLVQAFSRPEPRFRWARVLARRRLATSLMDCSDGLEASARILSEASGLGVEVDLRAYRYAPALERWAAHTGQPAWRYVLQGGEDYELIWTAPASQWSAIRRLLPQAQVVGRFVQNRRLRIARLPGQILPLGSYGFAHFGR